MEEKKRKTRPGCHKKSPPRPPELPPNGFSQSQISRSVRSTTSTQCLCCIGTSSQIMSFVSLSNSACNDCLLNAQTEFSKTSNGMENVECAVRPLTNSNDAYQMKPRQQQYGQGCDILMQSYCTKMFSPFQHRHSKRK